MFCTEIHLNLGAIFTFHLSFLPNIQLLSSNFTASNTKTYKDMKYIFPYSNLFPWAQFCTLLTQQKHCINLQ